MQKPARSKGVSHFTQALNINECRSPHAIRAFVHFTQTLAAPKRHYSRDFLGNKSVRNQNALTSCGLLHHWKNALTSCGLLHHWNQNAERPYFVRASALLKNGNLNQIAKHFRLIQADVDLDYKTRYLKF